MTPADVATIAEARERKPGEYEGACPVHGGRSGRALAIGSGKDGRVLLHCRAGCDTGDVLAALGLRWADLMPDTPARRDPAIERRQRARAALRGWRDHTLTAVCAQLRNAESIIGAASDLLTYDRDDADAWAALGEHYPLRTDLMMTWEALSLGTEAAWIALWRGERGGRHHAA